MSGVIFTTSPNGDLVPWAVDDDDDLDGKSGAKQKLTSPRT